MRILDVFPPLAIVAFILVILSCGCLNAGTTSSPANAIPALTAEEARAIGTDAYVYFYPLVTMEMSRKVLTNASNGSAGGTIPVNQFIHGPALPTAAFNAVVRVNVDTLYSNAWLDLRKEPIILTVPDTGGRFYMMPVLDAWTNVIASPGKRTTGTGPGNFAIVGPGWNGTLPPNVTEIRCPTNIAWIIGRTQTNGPADYDAVHAIQAGYRLTPLSSFGNATLPQNRTMDPSVVRAARPVDLVNRMNASTYFSLAASLLQENPPSSADAPMIARMAAIGIVPGQNFSMDKLDPAVAAALTDVPEAGQKRILANMSRMGTKTSTGWDVSLGLGKFGTNYDLRAATTYVLLGANSADDAVYPMTYTDSSGTPLNGTGRYQLHLNASDMSVAKAFWSVTLYDEKGYLVPNSLNRYAISSWMPVTKNTDGSVDIYIQAESPGDDLQGNWLPAPDGPFSLTMRLYWPEENVLNGTWTPPPVTRAG